MRFSDRVMSQNTWIMTYGGYNLFMYMQETNKCWSDTGVKPGLNLLIGVWGREKKKTQTTKTIMNLNRVCVGACVPCQHMKMD